MATIKKNRCFDCGKVFCCSECRDEHARKKHPSRDLDCCLCRSEILAVKRFNDREFLRHVSLNHLPLCCIVCGLKFNNREDLESIGNCDRRRGGIHGISERQRPRHSGETYLFSPDTPLSLNKTPCGYSTLSKEGKDSTFEGDYNGNFRNVISPPEFTRHTSTPMHANATGSKANLAYKIPKSPIYSLKTPKTANEASKESLTSDKENDSPEATASYKDSENSSYNESNYQSFVSSRSSRSSRSLRSSRSSLETLRSMLLNKSGIKSEISRYSARNSSSGSSINGRKMLDAMEELDENARNDIEAEASVQTSVTDEARETQPRDSIKRVRFSDEFQTKREIETLGNDVDSTENEEFYEARQSISEMSMAIVDKLSLSSARINDENEKNFEAEKKKEDRDDSMLKSSDRSDARLIGEASSSSRVIMMLVVEKNGSIDGNDLAPLIDSSLKKLVSSSPSDNLGNSIDGPKRENEHVKSGTSVLSVDSYMSVSTVECYRTADSTINAPEITESGGSGGSTGGIFAAVAHAMKAAFKNLSSARLSKNATREALGENSSIPSTIPSTISESGGTSSKVLTSLASALASKTPKRSRDSDELTSSQSSEQSVDSISDVRSPVPKKPRGWCRIRGREPIARMRNNSIASPRGVSSETQCFQQGLLSVGDTILNLPSRAHQSTQTD